MLEMTTNVAVADPRLRGGAVSSPALWLSMAISLS
jgi:hypothetical protein